MEARFLFATPAPDRGFARIDQTVAERLGVRGVALLSFGPMDISGSAPISITELPSTFVGDMSASCLKSQITDRLLLAPSRPIVVVPANFCFLARN
ncbi:hypothetical protein [Ancylobacter sp.]|uniref:hypothetical protein n=1 Tax=Ancylobacter sp. TaxID=1872567 RepID=UPI003D13EB2D